MRRLVTRKELKTIWGIPFCQQWLLKLEERGLFPRRVKIGNFCFYYYDEVDAWVNSLPRANRSQPPEDGE